jgi:hypothetical protein
MDDTELEQAFRARLQHRADDADTTVDLLGPATSAARARRRRRVALTGALGLAAAALVTAVVVQNPDEPDGPDGPRVADDGPSEPLPTEWRTEAWHGLQIEVPANWGWGGAPDACGVGPALGATAYVGRPISNTDACGGVPEGPAADYVWLGPEWPLGVQDLGGGYVSETVDVQGSRLTVTTDNPALREHILESVGAPELCAPSLPSGPEVDSMLIEGLRDPSSAQVCAYAARDGSAGYDLVYATELDAEQATTFHAEVYDGGFESSPRFCNEGGTVDLARAPERVLVTITGEDPYGSEPVTQATVVDPSCREVSGSPGMVSPLSDTGMAAWAVGGLPVTLSSLIGPQG